MGFSISSLTSLVCLSESKNASNSCMWNELAEVETQDALQLISKERWRWGSSRADDELAVTDALGRRDVSSSESDDDRRWRTISFPDWSKSSLSIWILLCDVEVDVDCKILMKLLFCFVWWRGYGWLNMFQAFSCEVDSTYVAQRYMTEVIITL